MSFKSRSANVSRFSMVPRPDIPRSSFRSEQTHKSTFDAGKLIPVYLDEILPGDSVRLTMTAFCRLATPLFPVMDNMYLDSFFFFVPNRLLWDNWQRFMGEQSTPGASTSYLIPQVTVPVGVSPCTLADYFGIPVNSLGGGSNINALPFRAYNLIYSEWFRDQNIVTPPPLNTGDGPDNLNDYVLLRRGKRHDYFTSALPWPMRETSLASNYDITWRGGVPVSGIQRTSLAAGTANTTGYETGKVDQVTYPFATATSTAGEYRVRLDSMNLPDIRVQINDMRLAFAAQRLMERDARGGSRYTEIVRAHFGVISPDARMQRPEYLGGGSAPITVNPIVQQSATKVAGETAGGSTPLGQLGGVGTGVAQGHGFSASFTEHGYLIGLVSVRADLTYQQGVHKMWDRRTKYDFYWPAFANLGEQPVLRREIYATGLAANDDVVFGYQERWAEYRHKPNRISGLFRSNAAGTLDAWHLAQNFTAAPTLSSSFIAETPPLSRVLAAGALADNQQVLFDSLFSVNMVRAIPMFSVPGLADHF